MRFFALTLLALALPASAGIITLSSGTTVAEAPGGDGDGEDCDGAPTPECTGGTVFFDTRAGGAQSFQNISNITELENRYSSTGLGNRWKQYYNGGSVVANAFFETDVDGNGTNAKGIQWASGTGEQGSSLGVENAGSSAIAPDEWYTGFKMWLGKSPTGGGTGPETFTLGGGNPHQKFLLWNRVGGSNRLYAIFTPSGFNIRNDDANYNSPAASVNIYSLQGQVIDLVFWFKPSTRAIKIWVNDELVLDVTGQTGMGGNALAAWQNMATTYLQGSTQQVQYYWDEVHWYPPSD